MAIPTYDLTQAPPGRLTMPYVTGGAVETGRTLSGVATAFDLSGGGLVALKYAAIDVGNTNPARLRYLAQLAAILNSGARSIIVPLLVDFIQPVVIPSSTPLRTLFSDGHAFTDGMRFTQPPLATLAIVAAAASVNAGTLTLNIGGRDLYGGEWFEIVHPTRLNRAYQVTDIDSDVLNNNGTRTVTVGIRPTLREAVSAGTVINFNRPKCLMRLAPGTTIQADVTGFWMANPDISFIESFGST